MEKKNKKKVIIPIVTALGVLITGVLIFLCIYFPVQNENEKIYRQANELLYKYELDESEALFDKIYDYKDSAAKIGVIRGVRTLNETGDYDKAIDATVKTGGIIEVSFTTDGTPVDPITIKEKTVIDAKSYIEHYDFLGWNILSYYLIKDTHSFQLDLYSVFTPHVYSITYDVGDGFVVDPVRSYTYGTSVTATNAYRDGYTFTGYTVGDDETLYNPFVIKETDGQNFVLTAHYSPNQYTYQFDPMGGTCDTPQGTYTYDQTYLLPTPHKDGYVFRGWYTDYGVKLDSTINIDENTTLYAHYDPREYNINYELRGGQFLDTYPDGYNIESEDVIIPYPHREGYIFTGWVVEGQTARYSDIDYVIPTGTMGDITLHACWRKYTTSYGNSYISSLDEYDLPSFYPCDVADYLPGYVIPYNITSFLGSIFDDQLIDSFGVEKLNSTFDVAGNKHEFLVNKDKTAVYKMAFSSKTGAIELHLPTSVDTIKEYAFAYAPLHSITSESVINLEKGAFAHSTLATFDLPNVTVFSDEAFMDCYHLTSVYDSLLNASFIGDRCFYNTHLTSVTIGEYVTYLGPESFGGSEEHHTLTSFTCNSTEFVTMKDVLKGQTSSISLTLSKAVDSMKDIFGGTDVHLNVVTLHGVNDIPDEFLYEIPEINELITDVDITSIGDRAFSLVKDDVIPSLDKVVNIGESAFEGCTSISDVVLEDIKTIEDNAFKDSSLRSINIPATVEHLGDGIFAGCENLEQLIFESPLQLKDIGNINRLFSEDTFASKLNIEVRGEGTLPEKEFQNLTVGKSVTLGEKVSLSKFAFNNATSIQYVYFNSDYNELIPMGCFENASSLKMIDITNVVEISYYAFNNCTSLETIIDTNTPDDNTLGGTLIRVRDQAFGNLMKLDHIEIVKPEIEFGIEVFSNCTFEIWTRNGTTLSNDTLKDFQGVVYTL